ncbi:MAG TPA: hypothetical protein VNX01_15840 [Bacteroidia bacterium]|jgi:hypothetical protein|nr:hypothetical protein [Bacteroidia bacterium]
MKKTILILSLFVFACSKPISNKDKVMQAAQAYLKINDAQNIEFSKLDSVIDYADDILRQIAETQRQLLLKNDTVANQKKYSTLLASPKTKYYVINYINKSINASTKSWQMLVMDTTFKVKTATNDGK